MICLLVVYVLLLLYLVTIINVDATLVYPNICVSDIHLTRLVPYLLVGVWAYVYLFNPCIFLFFTVVRRFSGLNAFPPSYFLPFGATPIFVYNLGVFSSVKME